MKAYGQSKLANVLFARSLAKRLQGEVRRSRFNNNNLITDFVLNLIRKYVL